MAYPIGASYDGFEHWAVSQGSVWWNGYDQCVALVEAWAHNLRAPIIPCQYASELYANAQAAYWEKLPNTGAFVPRTGDIAVWHEFSTAGHTAIVRDEASTVNYIYTLDQNWSRYHAVSFETHHYTAEHIIGFLRRK